MILYPNIYCNKITDITVDVLEKNKIRGLAIDVDNTLIDYDRNLLEGVKDWIENIKSHDVKCMILSNTNKYDKVKKIAETLDIPYIYFAKKPLKYGFKKAAKLLELPNEQIGVIGDQIFTDVLGANRCKMFSILVNPIAEKDIFITRVKRPLESKIIKAYVKSLEEQKKKEE